VLEGMGEFFSNYKVANPSSIHSEGRRARALLRTARESLHSYLFKDRPETKAQIVFTSGGTEACNSMIEGFLRGEGSGHILVSSIEHPAVMKCAERFGESGFVVEKVGTEKNGVVLVEKFLEKLRPNTVLVSLMYANNESGIIQPVLELTKALRNKGYDGLIVSDTSQAISKSSVSVAELFLAGVDAVTVSGHKIGALPGIGALVINQELTCRTYSPLIIGGGQEDKLRGGTEFVMGAYSLGLVAKDLLALGETERLRRRELTRKFRDKLESTIEDLLILTPRIESGLALDNTLFIRFKDCRADDLVVSLDVQGISTSVGSACSSGKQEVSVVALEMGLSRSEARECLRISFDWDVLEDEILKGVELVKATVENMRSLR
jgi:cysteine desulfurase